VGRPQVLGYSPCENVISTVSTSMIIRQTFAKAISHSRCVASHRGIWATKVLQQQRRHISQLPHTHASVLRCEGSIFQSTPFAFRYQVRKYASLQDTEQVTRQNPRMNENGEEMRIEITPRAAKARTYIETALHCRRWLTCLMECSVCQTS